MAAPQGEHKLFIGGLPPDVTEDELRIVFSTYGAVTNMHVMRNSKAPTGHVSAFVSYSTKQAGDDAVQVLNDQYKIRAGPEQQAIKVSWARAPGEKGMDKGMGKGMGGMGDPGSLEQKLFVGGLPSGITDDELRIVFSTYGEVVNIHVMHTTRSQSGHISAFVTYKNKQSGDDAIQVLNGQYKIRVDEVQPINVSWARSGGAGKPFDKGSAGKGWDGGKGAWGPPPAWDKGGWGKGGYGWDKGGYGWDKGGWDKGWGGKGGGYDAGKGGGYDAGKGGGGSGKPPSSGNRLFIGNLPANIDEASVKYVFSSYGNVTHAHIMAGKSQTGQWCAFIEYATAQEADTAIATLHEKYEIRQGEGPIIVRHANQKGRSGPY